MFLLAPSDSDRDLALGRLSSNTDCVSLINIQDDPDRICLSFLPPPIPQSFGIDDWAFRRGRCYSKIIVDRDSYQSVELLGERDTPRVASWLEAKRQVGIVDRDRSVAYAEAKWQGASRRCK
jgi:hypothetical protein